MATLSDLKPSLSDLTDEELQEQLLYLRKQRRATIELKAKKRKSPTVSIPKEVKTKKQSLAELLKTASKEELLALLAKAEEELNDEQ